MFICNFLDARRQGQSWFPELRNPEAVVEELLIRSVVSQRRWLESQSADGQKRVAGSQFADSNKKIARIMIWEFKATNVRLNIQDACVEIWTKMCARNIYLVNKYSQIIGY